MLRALGDSSPLSSPRALHIRARAAGFHCSCHSLSLSAGFLCVSLFMQIWPCVQSRLPRRPPPLLSPQPLLVQASASYIMKAFGQLVTSQKVIIPTLFQSPFMHSWHNHRQLVHRAKEVLDSLIAFVKSLIFTIDFPPNVGLYCLSHSSHQPPWAQHIALMQCWQYLNTST